MHPYICLTHALGNQTEATRLADTLVAYGFRCRVLHEASDPTSRNKNLTGASLVLALTSPEAHTAESVVSDLRRLPDRGRAPICISLGDNPIDDRFCQQLNFDRKDRIERIPYPVGDAPDPTAVGMFIHRLFVCHLTRIPDAFSPSRCRRDRLGHIIALAVSAHNGSRDAAYALGCAYEQGDVLPVLEGEAATWIIRAAEAGLPDARLHLGELFLTGWGVEPDEARAFSLFSSVADEGDVRGEYRLALCYLNGAGVVPDPTRAVSHLRRAARWGYAPALYRLGLLARDGVGIAPDARLALRCFYHACLKDAAEDLNPTPTDPLETSLSSEDIDDFDGPLGGENTLSDMLTDTEADDAPPALPYLPVPSLRNSRMGRQATAVTMRHMCHHIEDRYHMGLRANAVSSFRYKATYRSERAWVGSLTRSARITVPGGGQASGHPVLDMHSTDVAMGVPFDRSNAALALARLLDAGDKAAGLRPRPTRALTWYRYALRQGNTEALYCLADAYRRGRGTPTDTAFATVLYRIASDWGDPRGQFSLGVAYERGLGVETDMSKATHHYLQAALAGYAPAQSNLGACYEYGIGVARNELTAVEWYVRAAEAGLPEALCRLGLCYETGRGVQTDHGRAFDLYRKAADQHHPYALYRTGICYDRREQHTEAVRCWQAAADAGLPDAAYTMAMCYSAGHGVRRDLDRAVSYLQDAAAGECLQAVCRLATCFAEGIGVARNTARALSYLQQAVHLWYARRALYTADVAPSPACAYTALEAAGDALYLLGLATLEGWDTTDTSSVEDRTKNAATLFSEAAEIGHAGALIALGDLYAYGRMTDTPEPDRKARTFYERAVRTSAYRRGVPSPIGEDAALIRSLSALPLPTLPASGASPRAEGLLASSADALGVNTIPALISLADDAITHGRELAADGATIPASEVFDTAWRCYAAAVEMGSSDARIRMAECIYHGLGRTSDPHAALRLLQSVDHRVTACLWLGDLWRVGSACPRSPEEADRAYCRGLATPTVDSEVGPYVLSVRRQEKAAHDAKTRITLLYRLATLRAVYPPQITENTSYAVSEQSAFSLLCEAILAGHTVAEEDLARMYAYERRYGAATAPAERKAPASRRFFLRFRFTRRKTVQPPLRDHSVWLSDFYTSLWPEPTPFAYEMHALAVPDQIPAHVTASVTPLMLAEALNYMGDCFFYGKGLPHRLAAAVACYRRVTDLELNLSRGEATPECVVWAQYSLGWCLLHGEGVYKNEREAVRRLTVAAKTHPEACYDLGMCYEAGIGVDNVDLPEAMKCYRRAAKLGHPQAANKVKRLERRERLADRAGNNE